MIRALVVLCIAMPLMGQATVERLTGEGALDALPYPNTPMPAKSVRLSNARNISFDSQGRILLAGGLDRRVWRITPGGDAQIVAGNAQVGEPKPGVATASPFLEIVAAVEDSAGNIFLSDADRGTTIFGPPGLYVVRPNGNLERVEAYIRQDAGGITSAGASGIIHDRANNLEIVLRSPGGARTVLVGDNTTRFSITNCDNRPATSCGLGRSYGLSYDAKNDELLFTYGHMVWLRDRNGIAHRIAGQEDPGYAGDGGPATAAKLSTPTVAVRGPDGLIYIADNDNGCIRKISAQGIISTAIGVCKGSVFISDGARADAVNLGFIFGLAIDSRYIYFSTTTALWRTPFPGASPQPTITPNGVVGAATFGQTIASGGWSTIFGANLAPSALTWDNAIVGKVLPTVLGGVSVKLGGQPAVISYVSPTQVNFLAPYGLPSGSSALELAVNGVTTAASVTTAPVSPSFFSIAEGTKFRPYVFLNGTNDLAGPDGKLAGLNSRPARSNDIVTVYATGGIPVSPQPPLTELPASPVACVPGIVQLKLGDAAFSPDYCGLILPGVIQMNFRIPTIAGSEADVPLTITAAGAAGPASYLVRVKP
jgi:uncharacterized protein (TIGR03437 family)